MARPACIGFVCALVAAMTPCAVALDPMSLDRGPGRGEAGETGGLRFDGLNDYVSMGAAPGLGLPAFTLELWFRMEGAGFAGRSGNGGLGGGIRVIPLITKGREEGEQDETDVNYFFGVRPEDRRLAADFEDRETVFPGVNHSVLADTPLEFNRWYHAALTYDGETWRVYLDGALDGERRLNLRPQHESIAHFGLGAALDSSGSRQGAFLGVMDRVRVWDHARTGAEIRATMNEPVVAAPGLVGAWDFADVSGGVAIDSSGAGHDGTIFGAAAGPAAPFDLPLPPEPVVLTTPRHGEVIPTDTAALTFDVVDQDSPTVNVTVYGRLEPDEADEFVIVAIPDTQAYLFPTWFPEIFDAEVAWIVDHADELNLAAVTHLGDIVDVAMYENQWEAADAAMSQLDTLPDLPYGLVVGNHDEWPFGDPDATEQFNMYFPFTRYQDRPWYGGHYAENNDNHYILYSAEGRDFVHLHLEYGTHVQPEVLEWANQVLAAHADREAIVSTHAALTAGVPAERLWEGNVIFDALKDNENFFLMLAGHTWGEGYRTDTIVDRTVHTIMADYQARPFGSNGWLRVMHFGPETIRVRTYSPWLDRDERDPDSEFQLGPEPPFEVIGSFKGVSGASTIAMDWSGLLDGRRYTWYVLVDDGATAVPSRRAELHVDLAADPPCHPDLDRDAAVDFPDLLQLLAVWGPCAWCREDLDGDDRAGFTDLLDILAAWGPCP